MNYLKQNKPLLLKVIRFIAVIGVMLIPTIYTTVFLGSMWDPYGKIDKLPVAVVNLDKPCNYNDDKLAVGDELVKNLKENSSLNFNFVNEEVAQEGLDNGSYYMIITIPEDFSSNATTLLDSNPKKMELKYKTNPGKNYIASKMSESAIQKIKSSIASNVTEIYAKSVFDEISSIGVQLSDAADGASQINDGLNSLNEGSNTISSKLKILYDSSLTFTDGITTYEEGVNKYLTAVEEIKTGSNALNSGINTLNNKTSDLSEGVFALNSGANSLYTGLQNYTSGVNSITKGASDLNSNSNALLTGSNTLSSGLGTLQKGSENLLNGLNTLSSSIGNSVNDENKKNLETLTTSLDTLNSSINTINDNIKNSSNDNLKSSFTNLGGNLVNVETSVKSSSAHINEIVSIKETDWFKNLDETTQANIINYLSTPLNELGKELNNIATETSSASNNLNSAVSGVTNVSSQIDQMKVALGTLSSNSNILVEKTKSTITNLYSGLENVQTTLNTQVLPGFQTLNSGIISLKNGSETLTSGITSYTTGVSKIYEGANTLNSNSNAVVNGAKELASGTTTLNNSVPTLTEGIGQIANGSNKLTEGLSELSENNSALKSGISTINSASKSISEGSLKLYNGSVELSDGSTKLKDGSETLKNGLEDGAKTIEDTKLSEQSKEMFASPVENVESINSYIANNGSAMSAYMMCVGLWVGCLALCILFPTEKDLIDGKENPKSYWSKKALKLSSIAVIQAVIMVSLIRLFNGLEPAYLGKTYLVAIVTSLAFMCIIYFMNILLGKVGSFILLVFMVLQLGGSAGTYPIELSNDFFKAIHNYMPFTYAVDGFRKGISTGLSIVPQITVLLCIGIACLILSAIVIIGKNKSTKRTLSQLLEEAL